MYSINLADLTTLKRDYPIVCDCMVMPILTQETVDHDKKRFDEIAVIVKPEIDRERWEAIVKIMRDGMGRFPGYHKNLFRMYEGHKRI
jgi:hypothetical protein